MLNVTVRIRPQQLVSKIFKKKIRKHKKPLSRKLFPSQESRFYIVSNESLKRYVLTRSTRPIKQIPYFSFT